MQIAFALGVGAFGLSTAAYLVTHWRPTAQLRTAARVSLTVTVIGWTLLLGWWLTHGSSIAALPLWLGGSAWALSLLYLLMLRRYAISALGSFISGLATALAHLALVVAHPVEPRELGLLLGAHIGLAFLGIVAFAFATGASVLYLIQARTLKKKTVGTPLQSRLPPLDVLDRLALRSILVGFPFYTVAVLIGSAFAVQQGGGVKLSYVLAMVSWVIYGIVLQARLTAGWRGRKAAFLTAIGLLAALVVVTQYSLGVA